MQYKRARKPLPQIARDLGVDGVLEGSVMRDDDRVRITVQLIEATSDAHLWAESYERDLRDILSLQHEVAGAIADEIQLELSPRERARLAESRPVDPEAHEAYLKGRFFYHKGTHADTKRAIGYFEQAVQIDPDYALGFAGLADAYT
jgi:hypothetical protein